MLKQAILYLLTPWDCGRREHASLTIQTLIAPLIAACESSSYLLQSVRDGQICREAQDAQGYSRPFDDDARYVSLDMMPEVLGGSSVACSDSRSWSDRLDGFWTRAKCGWDMSPRISDAVFRENESWNNVSIRGDWIQVQKTFEALEAVHTADPRIRILSLHVEDPMSDDPSGLPQAKRDLTSLDDVNRATAMLLPTMRRLPNLHTFRIHAPPIHRDWFTAALSTNQTVQPSIFNGTNSNTKNTINNAISTLSLGPFTHPFLYHGFLSQVKTINLWKWGNYESFLDIGETCWDLLPAQDALIDAIERSGVPVEHLELFEISRPGNLEKIARVVPGVKILELGRADVDQWSGKMYFEDILPALKNFPNVTTLSLPVVQVLDRDYNPPWCGMVYVENPGFGKEVDKQYSVSVGRLVELVKGNLPVVERVRFGVAEAWWHLR